jgi:hypothetical protein
MKRFLFLIVLLGAGLVRAQDVAVTFRYIPGPGEAVETAYVRADFNGWSADPGTEMTYVDSLGQWVYTRAFSAGEVQEYKIFVQRDAAGTVTEWVTDPLNPESNPADNNNSVLRVAAPMIFQLARELDEDGLVGALGRRQAHWEDARRTGKTPGALGKRQAHWEDVRRTGKTPCALGRRQAHCEGASRTGKTPGALGRRHALWEDAR